MCARRVAKALRVRPADVPVEGYYAEDRQLTEYFRLLRALQDVDERRTAEVVAALPEFRRLQEITSARIYGRPEQQGKLLSVGCDAMSQALIATRPNWTLARLVAATHTCARETDDISLIGLAARIQDAVVLTALRESVVLYAVDVFFRRNRDVSICGRSMTNSPSRRGGSLMHSMRSGETLPPPEPAQASRYWDACDANDIVGRCVRIGWDDTRQPVRHYHWAIYRGTEGPTVQEFWHLEVSTTTPWTRRRAGRAATFARAAVPAFLRRRVFDRKPSAGGCSLQADRPTVDTRRWLR